MIPGARRWVTALLTVGALALALPAVAAAHAQLETATPSPDGKLAAGPASVTVTFSEGVSLVDGDDLLVVSEDGDVVSGPGRASSTDSRVIEAPITASLEDGTYTVRYRIIGVDSHVIPGVFVFGVGPGELAEPYALAGPQGPSETSAWAVSARVLQRVALGGLLAIVAFRFLVWGAALRRVPEGPGRTAMLVWGRDWHWMTFGVLAVTAMVAEAYLLVIQSAGALDLSVAAAATDATGMSQVLSNSRYGSLVQLRGVLLFLVFAAGAVLFLREYGRDGEREPATTGGAVPAVVLGGLLLAVMGAVAAQGHANVSEVAPLQIGAQLLHMASVSVWIGGLALVTVALVRLPAVAGDDGRTASALLLARLSRLAMAVVGVAIATGVVRSFAELDGLAELWRTGYGRSILYKIALLAPIGVLAFYNRKIVTTLRRVRMPNMPTLRRVRRAALAELGLSTVVIVIASVLVAQVPGGA